VRRNPRSTLGACGLLWSPMAESARDCRLPQAACDLWTHPVAGDAFTTVPIWRPAGAAVRGSGRNQACCRVPWWVTHVGALCQCRCPHHALAYLP